VDSGLDAEEVCRAIERNWWPAIENDAFDATVITAGGDELIPRPRRHPDLLPFVRGYETATVRQDSRTGHEFFRSFHRHRDDAGVERKLGAIGLAAETSGWSYPGQEDPPVEHRSLVALVRGPKMVVEYLDAGSNVPFVRGTFVAHEDVDDLLRQTEPPLHDTWDTNDADDDIHPTAVDIARAVETRVKTAVRDFRNQIRPPVPERRDLQLDLLEDLMGAVFDGRGSRPEPPPSAPPADISIHVEDQRLFVSEIDPTKIRNVGTVSFALLDDDAPETAAVAVLIRYKFVEDGAAGSPCAVQIDAPAGYREDPDIEGRFIGTLGRDRVRFGFTTAEYDGDWSGQLSIEAETLEDSS